MMMMIIVRVLVKLKKISELQQKMTSSNHIYDDFRSSNAGVNEPGYSLYVFEIRCQQYFTASQLIKVGFKILAIISAGNYGYALVLTNKLVSIISYGQRQFDLF